MEPSKKGFLKIGGTLAILAALLASCPKLRIHCEVDGGPGSDVRSASQEAYALNCL